MILAWLAFASGALAGAGACALGARRHRGRVLRELMRQAADLGDAIAAGRVDVRFEPARIRMLAPALERVNGALDAFIAPLLVSAECVERIGRGDIPGPLTEPWSGEFEGLRTNLNACMAAVGAVLEDTERLARAAVEGELATRADPARHQGDFRRIVDGVNRALDAVAAPVGESAAVLQGLAARDLRGRVRGDYAGDHARMKEAVNASAEALARALAQVSAAARRVSAASDQIAGSSKAIADGGLEQAAALERTTHTLEAVAATTGEASRSAREAHALADDARTAAREGVEATARLTGSMGRIHAAAQDTSQVVRDIHDIASQSHLLGLNAAVEAARAGEAGRSFAVVAEEVRSLALRSQESARRTEALIRESVRQAEAGGGIADEVRARLEAIGGAVERLTDLVARIAGAAEAQARDVAGSHESAAQIEQVMNRTAAEACESSNAAQALADQARELAELVATFRGAEEGEAAGEAPGALAPEPAHAAEQPHAA